MRRNDPDPYYFLVFLNPDPVFKGYSHGRMNYKDTEPYMSAFLKN
jgi:hypothetical protein